MLPSVDVAADWKVGAVPAAVELLVTAVLLSVAASFPAASWMALLSFELDGSVYATVTV